MKASDLLKIAADESDAAFIEALKTASLKDLLEREKAKQEEAQKYKDLKFAQELEEVKAREARMEEFRRNVKAQQALRKETQEATPNWGTWS